MMEILQIENLGIVTKTILRGKFMALDIYFKEKKKDISKINVLSFHLKKGRERTMNKI